MILHNSISLDGSLTNFQVNMRLHYEIAASFNADAHLIGSNTIKTGISLYGNPSREEITDFDKPNRNDSLPFWIIIDSRGILKGSLHEVRRFEGCKDIILLTSKKTSKEYFTYLDERNYTYYCFGDDHVNIEKAIQFLSEKYNIDVILVDTGSILGNILLDQGLVNEISLLIHPVIVGKNAYQMFARIPSPLDLKLKKKKMYENNYIWATYHVE